MSARIRGGERILCADWRCSRNAACMYAMHALPLLQPFYKFDPTSQTLFSRWSIIDFTLCHRAIVVRGYMLE